MKILQLCKKFPFPLDDGESIANVNLAKGMTLLGHRVDLFALNTFKDPYLGNFNEQELHCYHRIFAEKLDNRIKLFAALKSFFANESYHISRYNHAAVRKKLIMVIQKQGYDLIQMESIFWAPYLYDIKIITDSPIVLRAHNVEHKIWERESQFLQFGLKKWYLGFLAKQLKSYEEKMINEFDLLICMSNNDLEFFKVLGLSIRYLVLGIGLDLDRYKVKTNAQDFSICFIGSLDWSPNLSGLLWFIAEIWPRLCKEFPKLKFHIAGKNTPDSIQNFQDDQIVVHGKVKDARAFICKHSIMLVPLRSGSGLRVKILEAMALGKTVISTTIGAEGIGAVDQSEIFICDEVDEFIECLEHIFSQKYLSNLKGNHARIFVETKYSMQIVAKELEKIYQELLL